MNPYILNSILWDGTPIVEKFVKDRIPDMTGRGFLFPVGIGIIRGTQLVGGVIYHNWRELDGDIEVSVAFDDPRWCLPQTLRVLFTYPFVTLNCERMTAIIARKNKRSRRLTEGLGFRLEGTVRRAIGRKSDAMLYGMLRSECRFLKEDKNGQVLSAGSAGTA